MRGAALRAEQARAGSEDMLKAVADYAASANARDAEGASDPFLDRLAALSDRERERTCMHWLRVGAGMRVGATPRSPSPTSPPPAE
jgi:hypothetical protein